MKTGSMLLRLIMGVPVVAGFCLVQGCATSGENKTAETPPAVSNLPPEVVALPPAAVNTNKARVEAPAVPEKEKAVLKPVPPMTTPYTVKAGETLSEIALKFGKRWQDVVAVNEGLTQKSHLRTGQTVLLPNPVDIAHPKAVHTGKKAAVKKAVPAAKPTETAPAAEAPAAAAAAGEGTYTVKKNDTIATIAAKHHVKRADLEKANNLTEKSHLKLGQKLVIPAKGESAAPAETAPVAAPVVTPAAAPAIPDAGAIPPPPAVPATSAAPAATPAAAPAIGATAPAAPEPKTYKVKEGEDVYAVAIRWGVSPAELKALNNLTSSELQPGQELKIPVVASPAP